jgi:hypothetical protein
MLYAIKFPFVDNFFHNHSQALNFSNSGKRGRCPPFALTEKRRMYKKRPMNVLYRALFSSSRLLQWEVRKGEDRGGSCEETKGEKRDYFSNRFLNQKIEREKVGRHPWAGPLNHERLIIKELLYILSFPQEKPSPPNRKKNSPGICRLALTGPRSELIPFPSYFKDRKRRILMSLGMGSGK